jgi:soluble lytic murein transglycosylase-like protein
MISLYLSLVMNYCQNPRLGMAIMKVESSYNANATNGDSYGLMQVRLPTAKMINCVTSSTHKELLGVETNIKCGCKYLNILSERYEKLTDQIAAYNAGQARVCRTGILKPSNRPCLIGKYINQDYVDKVFYHFSANPLPSR